MTIVVTSPKPKAVRFAKRLEVRAKQIISNGDGRVRSPALSSIESELALTVDQLRQTHRVHGRAVCELRDVESSLSLEMERFTPLRALYKDHHYEIRTRISERVFRVQSERRRIQLAQLEHTRPLQDKLLTLLQRHRQLAGLHERRGTRA